jgi:hypothetical protein
MYPAHGITRATSELFDTSPAITFTVQRPAAESHLHRVHDSGGRREQLRGPRQRRLQAIRSASGSRSDVGRHRHQHQHHRLELRRGQVAVVLTAGGQPSNPLLIDYAPPSIHAISPLAAPAGTTLTIQGASFGVSPAVVTIAGNVCSAISQTHTTIECTVPAGTGEDVPVVVTSAAQSSNTIFFSYVTVQGNRPTIDVSPVIPLCSLCPLW